MRYFPSLLPCLWAKTDRDSRSIQRLRDLHQHRRATRAPSARRSPFCEFEQYGGVPPLQPANPEADRQFACSSIKASSYRQARASAVRSVKRPSPGCTATGKKRRYLPLAVGPDNRKVDPRAAVRHPRDIGRRNQCVGAPGIRTSVTYSLPALRAWFRADRLFRQLGEL